MQAIVPLHIVLELKAGAPKLNDFSYDPSSNGSTMSSSFPKASSEGPAPTKPLTLQERCVGKRTYSEVVVETHKPSIREVTPTASDAPVIESMTYFSGNPSIEKTVGLFHYYRSPKDLVELQENSNVLCMLDVPAYIACSELINFFYPTEGFREMKVIRDSRPNQYMVFLYFVSYQAAMAFYARYNGRPFSPVEEELCNLVFVQNIATTSEEEGGSLPRDHLIELPTCAVCLERLDDSVVTILCNHRFHVHCLEQWTDTTCPVCRYAQTPEENTSQKCSECSRGTDLWMCLICGYIGCGRYVDGHAYHHFEATGHIFTIQVGGNLVWDYVGDNYVHRIIQNAQDGKMVEVQQAQNELDKQSDKIDGIQLEYSCMLTQQLDKQRQFFEEKLNAVQDSITAFRDQTAKEIADLKSQLAASQKESRIARETIDSLKQSKEALEKKLSASNAKVAKLKKELDEVNLMAESVRKDKDALARTKQDLITKNETEIKDLREQLNDLLMHFSAQAKLENAVGTGELVSEELTQSSVGVTTKTDDKKKRRSGRQNR